MQQREAVSLILEQTLQIIVRKHRNIIIFCQLFQVISKIYDKPFILYQSLKQENPYELNQVLLLLFNNITDYNNTNLSTTIQQLKKILEGLLPLTKFHRKIVLINQFLIIISLKILSMKANAKTIVQTLKQKQTSSICCLQDQDKPAFNFQMNSKFKKYVDSRKNNQKYRNTCLVQNLELLQSVPYSSFKKYQLQTTPHKTPRKQEKSHEDQLYKPHHVSLKNTHINRIQQWKTRLFSKQSQGEKVNVEQKIARTNSLLSKKTMQNKYLGMRAQTYKTIDNNDQKQQPNVLFKNKQSKTMVNNNAYLRRLKTKLEFWSFSSFISERQNQNSYQLSPNISSIDQKYKTVHHPSEVTKKLSLNYTRSWAKKGKCSKFDQKSKIKPIQIGQCRPWSGLKGDIINDATSFI